MNTNINTLVLKDGYLCIKNVSTMYDKPEFSVAYWPIGPCNPGLVEGFCYPVGKEMVSVDSGAYITKDRSDTRRFELANMGATKPIAFELVPAVEPKTGGKKLRWYCGQWQKLLKTGWVTLSFANIP